MDSENRPPSPYDLSERDIVGAVPGVIYVLDIQQQKLVFVSRDIPAILGRKEEPEFIRSVVHPDDWPRLVDYFHRLAYLQDRQTADFEYRARHISGGWRWFHSRDRVFSRNDDGSVREIVGIATDATDRKAAQERTAFLANLNQALLPLAD